MFLKRLLIFLIFLFLWKVHFLFSQTSTNLEKFLNLQKLGIQGEDETIKELRKFYAVRDFAKVIEVYEKLGPFIRITPEDFLKVAEAYFYLGYPDKAIDLAERAQSLKRGTFLYCDAGILKVKAFLVLGKNKEAEKNLKELKGTFCEERIADKIDLFENFLKNQFSEKEFLKEFYEAKFNYLLLKGNLEEAEKIGYEFLNLTGEYRRGKDFFFKLAEAYFKLGKIDKAKKYYQLIITEWDLTKEATFSKFRLYQITYERAKIKELLPPKTIEDLLMYITQIKIKYTDYKEFVEEASFLEIKVNFERKNWEKARELAKEFLKVYPQSKYVSEVKRFYCEASFFIVPQYFLGSRINALREIAENEKEYLKESACGDFYYTLGKEFFKYRLYGLSLDYLLSAYDLKLSPENEPDFYLKLTYLANLYGEKEIFKLLWEKLHTRYSKKVKDDPVFLYLSAKLIMERDLEGGLSITKKIPDDEATISLKRELYYIALLKAIKERKYLMAFDILKTSNYEADSGDYVLILSETVDKAPDIFEKVLKEAKDKFPDNAEIKFLEAYYLEKKGDLKKTQELIEWFSNKKDYFSAFAQQQKKLEVLTKRVQEIIY